jgi:high-affinity nickel-transport protein
MISFFSIIALGFFLGMRHATDPDHVIAVTTIVSGQRSVWKSALIGAFWGVGHTLTILVVGAAMILFGLVIPPRYGLGMELSVGLMLIVLGLMNVVGFKRQPGDPHPVDPATPAVHSHHHSHGDYVHSHPHAHGEATHPHSPEHTPVAWLDRWIGRLRIYRPVRPLIIGIVHGLAGSAAVALLVLATIRDSRWAVAYLLVFGIGTVAGMMLITLSIASTFHLFGNALQFSHRIVLATGLVSLSFGLLIAYRICFVDGLLTSHPQWIPH